MIRKTFDLQVDNIKTKDGLVAEDIKSLYESLHKAEEAIAVLSTIVIQQNKALIVAKLGLLSDHIINAANLTKWGDEL